MNWPKIDSTVRVAFRKNGKDMEQVRGGTALNDLIAKDPMPDFDEMTEQMLCSFAGDHHIAIAEGLTREELIEAIRQALEINWEERVRGMVAMLDYIYADGPHPLATYRRQTAIVKAIRPELTLNMSCAQLAVLCDDGKGRTCDGRATVSDRVQRLYDEPIKKAGMRGHKAAFQKTDSAGQSYSDSAKGNKNRLGRDYLELHQPKKGKKAA